MRINPGPLISRLMELYSGKQKSAGTGASGPARSGKTDGIEFSKAAQEILALREKMAQTSPAREERIQAIKAAVDSGIYRPDARAVADQMLKQHVVDDD